MKTCFHRLLPLLLSSTLSVAVQAQFTFTTNGGAITITRYIGTDRSVTIPSEIDGYPVTSIGPYAFASIYSVPVIIPTITSVTIPDSVTSIGMDAFGGCTNLQIVMLGNHVANIGGDAFASCSSLTNINLPASVINLGSYVFAGCYNLTAITVDANNPVYSSVNGVLFDKSRATLIEYPGGLSGNYTIPGTVTNIADGAFAGCIGVTGVTIPDTVTYIGPAE